MPSNVVRVSSRLSTICRRVYNAIQCVYLGTNALDPAIFECKPREERRRRRLKESIIALKHCLNPRREKGGNDVLTASGNALHHHCVHSACVLYKVVCARSIQPKANGIVRAADHVAWSIQFRDTIYLLQVPVLVCVCAVFCCQPIVL